LEIWDERVRVHCSTFLDASSDVVRSCHCQDEQDDRKQDDNDEKQDPIHRPEDSCFSLLGDQQSK
jgi:hypothetical protein